MSKKLDHPLRRYRIDNKLSREALGAELSVEAMTIYRWETGAAMPGSRHWPKIKAKTGVTPEQLAAFKESVAA